MDTSNMTDKQVEDAYAAQEEEQKMGQSAPLPSPQTIPTVQAPIATSQPEVERRGLLADMAVSAVHGAESAVRQTAKTALDFGKNLLPPVLRDAVDPASMISSDTLTPKPETTIGKIESDLVRFGLGFVGAGTVLKGSGLVAGAAKSAVSTMFTSDPQAERLSNLLEEHPYLQNPVSDYLAADPSDSFAESKFKSVVEDLGLSAIGGTIVKVFRMVKVGETASKGVKSSTVDAVTPEAKATKLAPAFASEGSERAPNYAALDPEPGEAAMRMNPATGEMEQFGLHAVAPEVKAAIRTESIATPLGLKLTPEHTTQLSNVLDEVMGHAYQGADVAAAAADKGKLNTDKMLTSDDVKAAINRFGEVLGPVMKAQGWTESQTHVQTVNLAEEIAVDADVLMGTLKTLGHDASTMPQTVVAGRMLLQTQAADLFSAARRAAITGEGKAEAIAKLAHVSQTLASIKMTVTGAARTTESGKIPVGEIDAEKLAKWIAQQGGHDNVIAKLAMTEGNPTALAKLARTMEDKVQDALDTAWRYHNTVFINGLLSSPKTQIVNALSTGLNVLAQPLNLLVGGTMRRDWADVREGVAIYKGLGTFLGDSFEMARKAMDTESPVLGGARVVEADAPQIEGNALWAQALRFPTRLLGASDEFFKQLSYRAKVSAEAAREGMDAVKSGSIQQHELDNFIETKFKAAFNKDGAALNKDALAYAEQATFTQDLDRPTWFGNFAQGISSLSSHPALRGTVLPFIRVPSNLLRQVLDYTPVVGQLRKKFLVDMQAGGSQASEALGRMTVGSGLWVGAGMLALNEKITGAAPKDPELAAAQKATGWRPYSYVSTDDKGNKVYTSFNRLDPFASFLGLAADYAQISGHLPEKKAEEWASIATLSIANNLMSKSYTKGVIDAMTALAGNDPNRAAIYIRQRVASYIPSVVGVAQTDTEMKELRGWMDGALAKTPGLSSTLEARRDIFGAKVQSQPGWPHAAWNPFPVVSSNPDPVTKELARLAQTDAASQFNTPSEHMGNIDLSTIKNSRGQSAYDRWLEVSGQGLKEAFLARMQSPAYQNAGDGNSWYTVSSRANLLRSIQHQHQDRALAQVKREFPALAAALGEEKANKLDVKLGRAPRTAMDKLLNFGK